MTTHEVDPHVVQYETIHRYFDNNELEDLCFRLAIPYEDLSGTNKDAKIRALIGYCERRGKLTLLVTTCKVLRSNAVWPDLPPELVQTELTQSDQKVKQLQSKLTQSDYKVERQRRIIVAGLVMLFLLLIIIVISGVWRLYSNANLTAELPSLNATADAQRFSFEDGKIGLEWQSADEAENLRVSDTYAYDGDYALAVDADIRANEMTVAGLKLVGQDLENKVVIFRVYLPENPLTDSAGQFSLHNRGIYGPYTSLRPGEWTTVAWATHDAPTWASPADLKLDVILGIPDPESSTNDSAVEVTFYIDGIEILPLRRNYDPTRGIPELPVKTTDATIYSFEDCTQELADWKLVVPTNTTPECTGDYVFSGQSALAVNVDLQPRSSIETPQGTMQLELRDPITTNQLIILRLYLPEDAPENIFAELFLFDSKGKWHEGTSIRSLQPGQWATLTWSTQKASWVAPAQVGFHLSIPSEVDAKYSGSVYIDLVEIYTLPNYQTDPATYNVPDDNLVESFEELSSYQRWITGTNGLAPTRFNVTDKEAFDGRYALEIQTTLQLISDTQKTAQILLPDGPDLHEKVVIYRVYLPENAPTNIAAQLFLIDDEGQSTWGKFTRLTPGAWTTIVWDTEDSDRPWESSTTPGIEFKLQSIATETDLSKYEDSLYIDLVEILPLPQVFSPPVNEQSLDPILKPSLFFDFEDGLIPNEIKEAGNVTTIRSGTVGDVEVQNVLQINLNLPVYNQDTVYPEVAGGVCVPVEGVEDVYGVRASILAPVEAESLTAGFTATGLLGDKETLFFGGFNDVIPGEWTPLFWGSAGFAYNDPDNNNEWLSIGSAFAEAREICLWITSDEGYEGVVYIDNVGIYRLSK